MSACVSFQNIGIECTDVHTIFVGKFDVKFEFLQIEMIQLLAWKKFVGTSTVDSTLHNADIFLGT